MKHANVNSYFGFIMKKGSSIFLLFLLLTINLSAQIVYDTIPDNKVAFVDHFSQEWFVFKDFKKQVETYFNKYDYNTIDCYGKKVFVSTIFGKDGELKNTCIVKSVNPVCDSIAFYFVKGLIDWVPGLERGKFVDIPFVFPVTIGGLEDKERSLKTVFFDNTNEEYKEKKDYFDFVNSKQYEKEIIKDFVLFKNFMAETFSDSRYVNILTDYKLKKNESIELKLNVPKSKSTHLLVRNSQKEWILYEYTLNKGKVRVPKGKKLLLIFYEEGITPLLQTRIISSENDTVIELELENYTKGRLLDEIKKYSL